jgi:DNA-binding response OmpR family regulator
MSHKILIADDSRSDRELYAALLADTGHTLEFAEDGQSAIDKVKAFHPDLVLLDIMMPKLSGFEICKIVKETPETRKTVILMITALDELQHVTHAIDVHTDDYLTKPIDKTELLKRVELLLKLKDVRDKFVSQ